MVEPLDLAPASAGGCWVADRAQESLLRLDREGGILQRHDDLGRVAGVREDPLTGTLWFSVPDRGRVYRLDPDGTTTWLQLPGCPRRISGDWSGGCG